MTIPVNQIIRSSRKTLALIVKPDGSVIVRAPLRTSEKSIREFIEKNRGWIEKNQAKALATRPQAPKQYLAGEMFMFLGNTYPLEIVKGQKKDLLLDAHFKLAESAQSEAALAFERWYREQARQILNERVNFYACQYGFQYKRIGITSARTRWGSCSVTGSLNFSWRLIMAPLAVVDYVVVHELVHTIFHNHSKKFWHKVGTVIPDYKEHRMWLRKNGTQLLI
jgi:predicted metal-dependent hydrolase